MSTRGCVAIGMPLEWKGVYNHYDSYPKGLGRDVWNILQHMPVDVFCDKLLKYESWAAFLAGELQNDYNHNLDQEYITSVNPDPLYIEWVYIVDSKNNMLHVLASKRVGCDDWSKPSLYPPIMRKNRVVDYGRFSYKHILTASVKLDSPEPDWEKMRTIRNGIS